MPLQNPVDERFVYAVINCGSASDLCPLHRLGESEDDKQKLLNFQKTLNLLCLKILEAAVQEQEKGHEEFGSA